MIEDRILRELYILREVFQSPQTEVPYPQTNGGQPRLGMLVAVVHISVTYNANVYAIGPLLTLLQLFFTLTLLLWHNKKVNPIPPLCGLRN